MTDGFADGPAATTQFNGPTGIAVDAAGSVYITDNNRIREIVQTGHEQPYLLVPTFCARRCRPYRAGTGKR